jgi:hypothetical protein
LGTGYWQSVIPQKPLAPTRWLLAISESACLVRQSPGQARFSLVLYRGHHPIAATSLSSNAITDRREERDKRRIQKEM